MEERPYSGTFGQIELQYFGCHWNYGAGWEGGVFLVRSPPHTLFRIKIRSTTSLSVSVTLTFCLYDSFFSLTLLSRLLCCLPYASVSLLLLSLLFFCLHYVSVSLTLLSLFRFCLYNYSVPLILLSFLLFCFLYTSVSLWNPCSMICRAVIRQ